MKFIDLSRNLIIKVQNTDPIAHSDYPDRISLGDDINKKIKKIDEYSRKPSVINRSEGTVNYEYGFSTFNFIEEVHTSSIIRGTYYEIRTAHSINFKPDKERNGKYRFELNLDGRVIKSNEYDLHKIKNLVYGFSAIFHSHPYQLIQHKKYLSFFSNQDLSNLKFSSVPIVGIVVEGNIWLACTTKDIKDIHPKDLHKVSEILSEEGVNQANEYVKNNLNLYGVIFYHGKIGKFLRRL